MIMCIYCHIKPLFSCKNRKGDILAANRRKDNKGRILRKGESQRQDKTYMYRWTDVRGQRQCIYDNSLEGLRKQEQQVQLDTLQGIQRDNITLNQIIERYFSTKASWGSNTIENYRYYFRHSIQDSYIGSMKVKDIRKSDLLLYFKSKSIDDGFSNGTIHILNKIIHPALQLAVEDDIIRKNPSDGCMKDYPEESEIKYALTLEQEKEFLQRIMCCNRIKRYYSFFAILLYTGLRISEAIGLTWNDVDLNNNTIKIDHQLQYRKIDGEMKWFCIDARKGKAKTKTESGNRVIPINKEVRELFISQRKEWFKMSNKSSSYEIDGYKDFVFLSHKTGRCLYPSNVRRMLKRVVEMNCNREVQLPNISPHILRHTTCTRYAESGIDIKTIQYLMGHTDIKTTIKVYNHTDLERAKRELEKYNTWQNSYTNFYTNLG